MPGEEPPWRPALGRHTLLRYDRVRGANLLLMPERAVLLSREAGMVLRLCDGSRTTAEIVDVLARDFPDAPVNTDVLAFLDRVRAEGWLR